MITIDDCISGKATKDDLHLGWVLSLVNNELQLSYTFREFDWKSVQNAPNDKVNKFLNCDIYRNMKTRLEKARSKRKSLFYQAYSISDMKSFLEQDNVKVDIDKLVRAKARSLAVPKHLRADNKEDNK